MPLEQYFCLHGDIIHMHPALLYFFFSKIVPCVKKFSYCCCCCFGYFSGFLIIIKTLGGSPSRFLWIKEVREILPQVWNDGVPRGALGQVSGGLVCHRLALWHLTKCFGCLDVLSSLKMIGSDLILLNCSSESKIQWR